VEEELRTRWYMGWACTEKTPLQEQVQIAVAHFRKRHGRLPAVVAVHQKDGLTPPEGVALIGAEWVPDGYVHLYF
jgi:hypothetical protein